MTSEPGRLRHFLQSLPNVQDHVLLVLCGSGWLAILFGGFINSAPNRLAKAQALTLWQAPALATAAVLVPLALLTAALFIRNSRARCIVTLVGAALLLTASLYAAGRFASVLTSPDRPAARQSLGLAFWALFAVAAFATLNTLQRPGAGLVLRVLYPILVGLALLLMALSGLIDDLSLVKEFMTHRAVFADELVRHIGLVAMALFFALLIGVPLTLLVLHRPSIKMLVFSSLNILQTIPSIALFGLLIAPLSGLAERLPVLARLGIGGTGAAPAVIALTLYALLPLVRNFSTGLAEVAADVKDAARGLGFTARRMFLDVELPLALPALVSGLRIVTVQSIGLAAVAALIGAGGLGTFVFEGIGQYALDLVLVGAFPIILLALAADGGFQLVQRAARRWA
ncbi:MAG: ABC transporter permease [Beijerinckiaceae bacterium]